MAFKFEEPAGASYRLGVSNEEVGLAFAVAVPGTDLVPFAEDYVIPRRFFVRLRDTRYPFCELELEVTTPGRPPEIAWLYCGGPAARPGRPPAIVSFYTGYKPELADQDDDLPHRPLRPDELSRLPLELLIERATRLVARRIRQNKDGSVEVVEFSPDLILEQPRRGEAADAFSAMFDRRKRAVLNSEHYREVARVYLQALADGRQDAVVAVEERWPKTSRSTIGRWIEGARRSPHDFLGPAPGRGKVGQSRPGGRAHELGELGPPPKRRGQAGG